MDGRKPKAFLEGFNSGKLGSGNEIKKTSSNSKTGSMALGDGKWITTKQGNHVFIEN